MKYEAIKKYRKEYPVIKMCKVLGLYPPNYYKWEHQEKKREERRYSELGYVKQIERIFNENRRNIGYRGVRQRLLQEGSELSEYRVRKIMKENGFYPETLKKYKPCHNGKKTGKCFENRVKQQFNAPKQNQLWAGDITYIKTNLGWVYLSVVLDLYNREVIGYSTSKKINTELVKRSLGNAILRNGTGEGLIFHSDRGSQYARKGFQEMLRIHGINGSMSRPGCPYDNSCVESFFATLKKNRSTRESTIQWKRYSEMYLNILSCSITENVCIHTSAI